MKSKFLANVKQFQKEDGTMFIHIPKYVKDLLELKKGEKVIISIENKKSLVISYICSKCNHVFDSNEEIPYCTVCESEKVNFYTTRKEDNTE